MSRVVNIYKERVFRIAANPLTPYAKHIRCWVPRTDNYAQLYNDIVACVEELQDRNPGFIAEEILKRFEVNAVEVLGADGDGVVYYDDDQWGAAQ